MLTDEMMYKTGKSSAPTGLRFILQSTQGDWANFLAQYVRPRMGWESITNRTLQGAVHEAINRCQQAKLPILSIYIIGHGSPEGQEFGSQTSDMLTPAGIGNVLQEEELRKKKEEMRKKPGYKEPVHRQHHNKKPQNEPSLPGPALIKQLAPYFTKDCTGELILGGCRVGLGDTARMLSKILPNVTVSAFNMAQIPTGYFVFTGDSGKETLYKNGVQVGVWYHANISSLLSITPTLFQTH